MINISLFKMSISLKSLLVIGSFFFAFQSQAQTNFQAINIYGDQAGAFVKTGGPTSLFGWGDTDNAGMLDPRPNPHPTLKTFFINHHTGLTFSAHSFYGGIRFYNQGYPNPYDASQGARLVMSITDGRVGIGTSTPKEDLSVNGNIRAKEVKVETANWPDYVFTKKHSLISLIDLETFIQKNKHLPEIPSADSVKLNGIELGEMNKKLLQKVEELTLYIIKMNKELADLREQVTKKREQ